MDIQYRDLSKAQIISYDIETFDPELKRTIWGREEDKGKALGPGEFRPESFVLGFSVADETGWSEYYNLGHPDHIIENEEAEIFLKLIHEDPSRSPKPACRERNLAYLQEVMSTTVPKLGVNIQYDLGFTEDKLGIPVKGKLMDLMNAEALLDENQGQYNLDFLSMKYLKIHKAKEKPEELAEKLGWLPAITELSQEEIKKLHRKDFREFLWRMPYEYVRDYGKGDTYNPIQIFKKQQALLEKEGLIDVFDRECKILRFCRMLRSHGVRIDVEKRNLYINQLQDKIWGMYSSFKKTYGDINVNSSKQLATLFDSMGIPYDRKEETNNPILKAAIMEKLSHKYPVCSTVTTLKAMMKIESSFLNGAFVRSLTKDNRLHAMYYNTKVDHGDGSVGGTVSGRFSSAYPNLEQVPAHKNKVTGDLQDWYSFLCRDIFLPEEGEYFTSIDLSGAEVRFIAHYGLLGSPAADAFRDQYRRNPELDTHKYVAGLTGLPRKRAKTLMFASAYGSGPKHIAEVFDMTPEEGKEVYNLFHEKFPVVKETSAAISRLARARGFIRTIDGRREHLVRTITGPNGQQVPVDWAYKMYNRLIQGSVAGYHKIATCRAMDEGIYDVLTPLHTIHDENTQSMPLDKEGQEALMALRHIFETAIPLRVPVCSMPEIGKTWGSTIEIPHLKKFWAIDMDFDKYAVWQKAQDDRKKVEEERNKQ